MCEELNVKEVHYRHDATEFVTYGIVPNFRNLGPRVGKLMPQVKKTLAEADGADLYSQMQSTGKLNLTVTGQVIELTEEDVAVRLAAKEGYSAAQSGAVVVVLAKELTDELLREGLANDVIRLIQDRRKELRLDYTDRITVEIETADGNLHTAVEAFRDRIMGETLTTDLICDVDTQKTDEASHTIGDAPLTLNVIKNG